MKPWEVKVMKTNLDNAVSRLFNVKTKLENIIDFKLVNEIEMAIDEIEHVARQINLWEEK